MQQPFDPSPFTSSPAPIALGEDSISREAMVGGDSVQMVRPTGVPTPPQATGSGANLRAWLRDLVVSVTISAFIIIFLYRPVRVEGSSMNPGLEDQERLFINEFIYRLGEIHRGDIVVFRYPHDQTKSYIKRVVALPGDTLRIDHGRVFVNNRFVPEPYVPSRFTDDRSTPNMELGPNEYFVLGDHRNVASDSRDFGPVTRDLIYGKAAFVYWPVDQAGVVH